VAVGALADRIINRANLDASALSPLALLPTPYPLPRRAQHGRPKIESENEVFLDNK
jgi:hypothetical protein